MPWHEMLRNGCENGEPYSVGSDVKPLLLGVVVRAFCVVCHRHLLSLNIPMLKGFVNGY